MRGSQRKSSMLWTLGVVAIVPAGCKDGAAVEGTVVLSVDVQEAAAVQYPAQIVYREVGADEAIDCSDSEQGTRIGVVCEPCEEDFVVEFHELQEGCGEPTRFVAWLAPISAEEADALGCGPVEADADAEEVEAPLLDGAPRAEAVAFASADRDDHHGCCGDEAESIRLELQSH